MRTKSEANDKIALLVAIGKLNTTKYWSSSSL